MEVRTIAAEKNFEERVKAWLRSNGIYPFGYPREKMNVRPCGYYEKRWGGGRYTKDGLPDMHIVVNGTSVEVELKAKNGKPSPLQLRNIEFIKEAGCHAYVIYPEDFDALKRLILRLKANAV